MLVSQSAYRWAAAIIGSRAVHLNGDRFLVPFADMFNYRSVRVCLAWVEPCSVPKLTLVLGVSGRFLQSFREANDGERFLKYHKRTDTAFQVVCAFVVVPARAGSLRRLKTDVVAQVFADRSVGQSQELFEDYGDNSNYV